METFIQNGQHPPLQIITDLIVLKRLKFEFIPSAFYFISHTSFYRQDVFVINVIKRLSIIKYQQLIARKVLIDCSMPSLTAH